VDAFVIEEARRNLAAKYTAALATLDSLLGRMQRLLASTARLAVPAEVQGKSPPKDSIRERYRKSPRRGQMWGNGEKQFRIRCLEPLSHPSHCAAKRANGDVLRPDSGRRHSSGTARANVMTSIARLRTDKASSRRIATRRRNILEGFMNLKSKKAEA